MLRLFLSFYAIAGSPRWFIIEQLFGFVSGEAA
jgi:hypothetical protein